MKNAETFSGRPSIGWQGHHRGDSARCASVCFVSDVILGASDQAALHVAKDPLENMHVIGRPAAGNHTTFVYFVAHWHCDPHRYQEK